MNFRSHILVLAGILTFATTLISAELLFCGNKYCGIDAECHEGKCECPLSQPNGDPAFRCHTDETISCVLIGDPALVGYGNSLTFLDFPCKYTLSKFDTPLLSRKHNNDPPAAFESSDPGRDRCRVFVHGTNAVTPTGNYYLKEVDVSYSINIGNNSHVETLKAKLTSGSVVYSYTPYGEITVEKDDEHGCLPRTVDTTNSIGVLICFMKETQLWSVGVPMCGNTYINFRAWNGESENQLLRPGVSLVTNGETVLINEEASRYPSTMCDSPNNDADDAYHQVCKALGVKGKRNCALYAFLNNNPPEQPHYCTTSVELFNLCTPELRAEAINKCGSIVTRLAGCVIKNNESVMNVFEACLVAVSANPATCPYIASKVNVEGDEDCQSFKDPC
uniref:VWFD domain-containing protein n=2 Tax=Arion vulgaris TaxID=1028688 RepID=A0A0B7BQP0_9EUPU